MSILRGRGASALSCPYVRAPMFTVVCLIVFYRLTERANQTIVTHLMKVVDEKADDWDSHLASVVFGYRVNKQGSTKISPFELLYGVRPRLPVDLNGDVSDERDDQSERDAAVSQQVVELAETVAGLRAQAG